MTTQQAERTDTAQAQPAENKGNVTVFQAPRLPFHPAIEERFGVNRGGWKVLTDAVFPAAKTADAIVMALSYCQARKLDIFKRPVHIVPMWSTAAGGYVETVWAGIAELRTTAFRTGQYAGCDATEFGPIIEDTFKGRAKEKGEWIDKSITLKFPEWARITIYRILGGRVCTFVGPKVKWTESYATIGAGPLPNDMWAERPEGQLEKCAEAAALRRAFPEELGNELTAEEMHGRRLETDARAIPAQPSTAGAPPDPDQPAQSSAPPNPDVIVGIDHGKPGADHTATVTIDPKTGEVLSAINETAWLNDVAGAFSGCEDAVTLGEKKAAVMTPMQGKVSAESWAKAEQVFRTNYHRITGTQIDAG